MFRRTIAAIVIGGFIFFTLGIKSSNASLIQDLTLTSDNGFVAGTGFIEFNATSGTASNVVDMEINFSSLFGFAFTMDETFLDTTAGATFSISNWVLTMNGFIIPSFQFGGGQSITGFLDTVASAEWVCATAAPDCSGAFNNVDNVLVTAAPRHGVPEPTTLTLMALGIAGLGLQRRKAA